MTANQVSSYEEACGPIAITNMIKMYGKKYNDSVIKDLSNLTIFNNIKDISHTYLLMTFYYYESGRGVYADEVVDYTKAAFQKYGKSVSASGLKTLTFTNSIATLKSSNKLMYLCLYKSDSLNPYMHHMAVGYAYTRLKSTSQPLAKTFIKMCDGISPLPRYLDVSLLSTSQYVEIIF